LYLDFRHRFGNDVVLETLAGAFGHRRVHNLKEIIMSKRLLLHKAVAVATLSATLFGITAGTASAGPIKGTSGAGKVLVCYQDPGRGKVCEWVKR
jgi:hypothetical protein